MDKQTMTDEIDKHHLKYSSPAIYKCTCGVVAWMSRSTGFKISEMPDGRIEYLPCGHATCAETEAFDCIICVMKG
jgi:hypothetical protein